MTVTQNARRYERQKVQKQVLVAWVHGTKRHVSHIENLGLGGLFIFTQSPPPVGTSLQLLFHAPEGEVRVRAIVRNLKEGRGMGVAIVSMDPEHRARLDRWLRRMASEDVPATPTV